MRPLLGAPAPATRDEGFDSEEKRVVDVAGAPGPIPGRDEAPGKIFLHLDNLVRQMTGGVEDVALRQDEERTAPPDWSWLLGSTHEDPPQVGFAVLFSLLFTRSIIQAGQP